MIYKFIDDNGTFVVEEPLKYNIYLPLTNCQGTILSSISPNLAGDIKTDNDHFLNIPASIEDIRSNLLCRREFFVKADRQTIRLSYPYKDKLEAGFLYQKITKDIKNLHFEILNFIPYDLSVEVMHVKIINKGKKKTKITPTSFMPLFGRSESNLRDHRHVSSLLNRIKLDKYGIFLKPTMIFDEKGHSLNDTVYFVLGYENNLKPFQGQFPTLEYFYGSGDLVRPDAVEKDVMPVTKKISEFDGKEACAAFRFSRKTLKAGQSVDYFLIMGVENDEKKIRNVFSRLNSPHKVSKSFKATLKYWQGYLSKKEFDFANKDFNNWLRWVKLQPTLRKLFGCSFLPHFDYGKGGRGWRDLWQDALTLLLTEPDKAKELILSSFKGVRIDGSNATIIARDGSFLSDRNNISRVWMDHGVWPYLSLRFYIHKTLDLDILLTETTYFRDHLLKRAKEVDRNFSQSDYILRDSKGKIYKGSILEHILLENLVQFFNVGEHNIIRLENADWNDGLDMAPDNGESVAFSFMYVSNLKDICVLLNKLKEKVSKVSILKEALVFLDSLNSGIDYANYKEKQKRLEDYLESAKNISGEKTEIKIDDLIEDLSRKAAHLSKLLKEQEWLSENFFNGYYDNAGKRVEGKVGGKIRMMLPVDVFAIMSSVVDEEQVRNIWGSIKKRLMDKKLGGIHLNTDFGDTCLTLGRAFGFSYGDKENGAFFNHMNVMLANALYKRGFVGEGFEVLDSIYKMAVSKEAKIYPVLPEYFNNQGRGLYLYLTGSASWYVYTLTEEVLGIKFVFGDIHLKPQLISKNFTKNTIETSFSLADKRVRIIFERQKALNSPYKIKEVILNGEKVYLADVVRGYIIKRENLNKKVNTIKVYLG